MAARNCEMCSKVDIFFTLFLVLCFFHTCAYTREIYVSPNGSDSANCTKDAKCTLDQALRLASGFTSSSILASKGNYSLKTSHIFTRITSFGLIGSGFRNDVQITCEPNVSLAFSLSKNITLEGLKFRKCAGWHRSTVAIEKNYPNLRGAKFKAALDFRYCRNLRMYNVEISSSPGLGVNLYDVGGIVNFTHCLFADNFISKERMHPEWEDVSSENGKYVYSGGGVYVMLNPYAYVTINVTPGEHDSYQHNNIYEFSSCHFLRNKALWLNAHRTGELDTPELPFSRGGGLAIFLPDKASGCLIKIRSSVFASNEASWGGGLQVEMRGTTENNSLEVESSVFRENGALLDGGGARIGNLPEEGVHLRINRFKMTNCSFEGNTAIFGGGASLYGTTIPRKCFIQTNPAVTQFYFHGCNWVENVGSVGAAIGAYLYNRNEDLIGPEIPYRVCFQNDTWFRFNRVNQLQLNLTIGQGTLYSLQVPLIFKGNAQFVSNTQSALVLDGSTLMVYGSLHFIKNTGVRGGAIAMYGRSRILLQDKTSSLTFEANKCEDKGGALYIEAPGAPLVSFNATGAANEACFFGYSNSSKDYDEWNTSVVFRDNSASLGKSVYATTLKNCRRAGESRQHNNVLKWKFVKFVNLPPNSTSLLQEVATEPVDMGHNESDWEVPPGEVFDATVQLFDEVGNLIPGIVDVSVKTSSVQLDNSSPLFLATGGKISSIILRGEIGSLFDVKMSYTGSQVLEKMVENVTLKGCHAGFSFDKETLKCECIKAKGVSYCDNDGKTVFIKGGYWAGNVDGEFATYFCPTGYCNSLTTDVSQYKYIEGFVCSESRNQSSVLCGECKDDYTISFGSQRCVKACPNWHVIFAVLVSLGFLLVVVGVMLIDLDIASGYLNAWLYSYQIMKLLTPDGFEFDPVIEFVIGFTNVYIHIGDHSFCFIKGLNDADKMLSLSLIPLLVLVTVGVLKSFVDRYPDCTLSRMVLRRTPTAPYRAVCTIFVLCYTNITRISLSILHPAKIVGTTFLYDYGGYEFLHGRHLMYFVIAMLYIIVIVLPFPLLLLFRPTLTRFLRPVFDLHRWDLYLDAFQGCFKDRYRWFAAFYFLCRIVILLFYTYLPANSVKRVVLEVTCIFILSIFASLKPYRGPNDVEQSIEGNNSKTSVKKSDEEPSEVKQDDPRSRVRGGARGRRNEGERGGHKDARQEKGGSSYKWINKIDILLLTNLSVITVISSPLATDDDQVLTIVVRVLAWVPLVLFSALLGCRVLEKCYETNCIPDQEEETATLPMSESSDTE